jgi:hypothetical protein
MQPYIFGCFVLLSINFQEFSLTQILFFLSSIKCYQYHSIFLFIFNILCCKKSLKMSVVCWNTSLHLVEHNYYLLELQLSVETVVYTVLFVLWFMTPLTSILFFLSSIKCYQYHSIFLFIFNILCCKKSLKMSKGS